MADGIFLVLDQAHLRLSVEYNALRVDFPDGNFRRYPPNLLGQIQIHGSPEVRSNVWNLLADHGIPVTIHSSRGSGEPVWVGHGLNTTVHYRIAQHAVYANAELRLDQAKYFVRRKLEENTRVSEQFTLANTPDFMQAFVDIAKAGTNDQIMGIEGWHARAWYAWMRPQLNEKWRFLERNRRPPRDPVNALLSLGYTQITHVIHREVLAAGLDPYLGFLHVPSPGRASLSLDLSEPFRPWVDAFVLSILETLFTPDDFSVSASEGCRMRKEIRSKYYTAWSDWLQNLPGFPESPGDDHDRNRFRRAVRKEVHHFRSRLADVVSNNEPLLESVEESE